VLLSGEKMDRPCHCVFRGNRPAVPEDSVHLFRE
jgi:hypothetical protein